MKSSYDIRKEMEKEFGNDFIIKMEQKKDEYERLKKELECAKSFEEKINDKVNKLRKTFVYIPDDYNLYPDEQASNYLYQLASSCVENKLSKEEEFNLYIEKQFEYLDSIEDDAKIILKLVEEKRKQVIEEKNNN
jgi:ABC-type multidrug transport system ATPase subunit